MTTRGVGRNCRPTDAPYCAVCSCYQTEWTVRSLST